ncbi:MAG: ABC transporter substrate-binding protein [Burkholderiaceae bacterium]
MFEKTSFVLDGRALRRAATCAAAALTMAAASLHAETITIGIGTQNTTTNTVTGGIVLKELGLLDKHLPRTGKYKDAKYVLNWQNFTSGPPVTNGMMANNIQIGMMGDYPLMVNGATGQATGNETQLVAITAYNEFGGGNGIVVPKDSPYYDLADLKGKQVSVPFGSAAHGMMLNALQMRGLKPDFWTLISQSPEIGSTNLKEKRIDAHGDFVPFAELLPFRGFARKIFDGVETKQPTFHGVVIRKDFGEKYPEIVVAYIKAMMEANDWVRANPRLAAEKIADWTKIDKEVVYIFLGPNGVHTLDPTIKPRWGEAMKVGYDVLQKMNLIKPLDTAKWVDDGYVRQAFKELGKDYDAQVKVMNDVAYVVSGNDPVCNKPIDKPEASGQIWIQDGDIVSFSSAQCTLAGVRQLTKEGRKIGAVYLMDQALKIKVFADTAFYAVGGNDAKAPQIVPFLLKKDAEEYASRHGAKLATYDEALSALSN